MSRLALRCREERLETTASVRTSTAGGQVAPALSFIVALAGIRPQDCVTVIGHHLSNHLLWLARLGCRSATGVAPSCPCLSEEIGDVAWIAATGALDERIAGALVRAEGTRLIVVELTNCTNPGRLQPFLERLREMGFVRQSYRRIAGQVIVLAQHRAVSNRAA